MAYDLQNFYKQTLLLDWSIGTGNFYVSVKPTISSGWLVISPNNSTIREIIKYTATGTDLNGDYVTVSQRGVGGTTEQIHTQGEPIRMNITAEYWDDMNDQIANIVAAGVVDATTTTFGGGELATPAEIDAGTATSGAGHPLLITPDNVNTAHNIPFVAPGASGNIMNSNGTDWISSSLSSLLPTPAFYQRIAVKGLASESLQASCSNQDGSVIIISTSLAATEFFRYERDTNTGIYKQTHAVNATPVGSYSSMVIVGSYLYGFYDAGNSVVGYRYNLADLTSETLLTMPSIDTSGSNYDISTWTDGTYLYLATSKASTTAYRLSISGTTLTTSTTSTTAAGFGALGSFIYDGTNIYNIILTDTTQYLIRKANDVFLSAFTDTTIISCSETDGASGCISAVISTNRLYIGRFEASYNATAVVRRLMVLVPVTKP